MLPLHNNRRIHDGFISEPYRQRHILGGECHDFSSQDLRFLSPELLFEASDYSSKEAETLRPKPKGPKAETPRPRNQAGLTDEVSALADELWGLADEFLGLAHESSDVVDEFPGLGRRISFRFKQR